MYYQLSDVDLLRYFTIPNPTLTGSATLFTKVNYSDYMATEPDSGGRHNFDKLSEQLYLGRLPDQTQLEAFPRTTDTNDPLIKSVVSISTYQELSGRGLNHKIITPAEWLALGIDHHLVIMPDLTADVSMDAVLNAIYYINESITAGKPVYLHCQAGMSRSVMIAVLYFCLFGDGNGLQTLDERYLRLEERERKSAIKNLLENTINYISQRREHINLLPEQLSLAENVLNYFVELKKLPKAQKINKFDSKEAFLISLTGKQLICQLPSFKSLAIYAVRVQSYYRSTNRTELIRDFFWKIFSTNEIHSNSKVLWYEELLNNTGPLKRLVEAKHQTDKDTSKRTSLVNKFKAELESLLNDYVFEMKLHVETIADGKFQSRQ